ncbi:hypothetical protein [Thiomonas sp.]
MSTEYWIVSTPTGKHAFKGLAIAQAWMAAHVSSGPWQISKVTMTEQVWDSDMSGTRTMTATMPVKTWVQRGLVGGGVPVLHNE